MAELRLKLRLLQFAAGKTFTRLPDELGKKPGKGSSWTEQRLKIAKGIQFAWVDLDLDTGKPADKIKRLSKQLDGDCAPVRSLP